MGVHDGHRQRTKQRFLRYGLDSFDDVNVLELLLFYAAPRRDTNPVAHALLDRFGTLSGVLEASPAELERVAGVGEWAAALLTLIPAVSRRYMLDKTPRGEEISTPADAGRYFLPRFMYSREERVLALFLDARRHAIDCQELSRGVVNAAELSLRRLAELALETRSSSVILAHNHLSGLALPSAEDEAATRTARNALALVGVELEDHIVVAGCEYVSMKESGLLR